MLVTPRRVIIVRAVSTIANDRIMARLAKFGEYACCASIRITLAGAPVAQRLLESPFQALNSA
jgi:hypothetical protein